MISFHGNGEEGLLGWYAYSLKICSFVKGLMSDPEILYKNCNYQPKRGAVSLLLPITVGMIYAVALVISCIDTNSFSITRDENPNWQIHPMERQWKTAFILYRGTVGFFCFSGRCPVLGSLVQVMGLPDPPRNGQGWGCSQLRYVELVAEGERGGLRQESTKLGIKIDIGWAQAATIDIIELNLPANEKRGSTKNRNLFLQTVGFPRITMHHQDATCSKKQISLTRW